MTDADEKLAAERIRGRVEYWKQITVIHNHFNDMSIRTRWIGLSAIVTLISAAALSEKENIKFRMPLDVLGYITLPRILLILSLLLLFALWLQDMQYYYKMVISSIKHSEKVESIIYRDLKLYEDGELANETSGLAVKIGVTISGHATKNVLRLSYGIILLVILILLTGSFLRG